MKHSYYGWAPEVLAENIEIEASEMCYVQYMPIAMPLTNLRIPQNLRWMVKLLDFVEYGVTDYVYVTAKHIFVSGTDCGNRPGWHSDGFGTDDINYIWCDRSPTEFAVQPFTLSSDCDASMREMEEQYKAESLVIYPAKSLLRLDQGVIHRTPTSCEPGYRTFVKISVSQQQYNLKGNAHNFLFDYEWKMMERTVERNHPTKEM